MKGMRSCSTDVPEMTNNEANVLRYAARYVVRHISKKIKKKNHPLEKELLCCANKLFKEGQQTIDSHDPGTAEEWTDLVDRGGLWHVRETTFHLFRAFEDETRLHVSALCSPTAATVRAEFLDRLMGSEDVQFYWCIAAANFEVEDVDVHNLLLRFIADLYLTIRGFSYASAGLENYKQAKRSQHSNPKACERSYTRTLIFHN